MVANTNLATLLQQGIQAHNQGNLDVAEHLYREILSSDSLHADANHLLALVQVQRNDWCAAEQLVAKALNGKPNEIMYLATKAMIDMNLGRLDEAESGYQKVLAAQPNHLDALTNLGAVYLHRENWQRAADWLQKALQIQNNYLPALQNLATAYTNLQHFDAAIQALKAAISVNEHISDFWLALANVQRQKGDITAASKAYERAAELEQTPANASLMLVRLLLDTKDLHAARQRIDRALALPQLQQTHVWWALRGELMQQLGEFAQAVASYEQANLDTETVRNNLGFCLAQLGENAKAEQVLTQCLESNPAFIPAYVNYGNCLRDQARYLEAQEVYERGLSISPHSAAIQLNLGICLQRQADYERAESLFTACLSDKDYAPEAQYNLACSRLARFDWMEGWKYYRSRWQTARFKSAFIDWHCATWQGEVLNDNQHLHLWSEQGVGDVVLFASMLPNVLERAKNISLSCDSRLIPVLQSSFPQIRCYPMSSGGSAGSARPNNQPLPVGKPDFHLPLGELGSIFRLSIEDFSVHPDYLAADKVIRETLNKSYPTQGLRIGIAWHSVNPVRGKLKSIPLQQLANALLPFDAHYFNVQYGDRSKEIEAVSSSLGFQLVCDDRVDSLKNLHQFVAQLSLMDLIISTPNAAVDFAAALGKPVLLLQPVAPDWRWGLSGEVSPWYPTVRQLRQDTPGEWDSVLKLLTAILSRDFMPGSAAQ